METHFFRVKDPQSVEDLIKQSETGPVIIFKHSTTCPVSASAYREMEQVDGEVNLIEVQNARSVSKEIATRVGIEHESPQVIVLRRGKAVWNASHFQIKANVVTAAVQANT
jgi:bacillithiol system protein YtxJ